MGLRAQGVLKASRSKAQREWRPSHAAEAVGERFVRPHMF